MKSLTTGGLIIIIGFSIMAFSGPFQGSNAAYLIDSLWPAYVGAFIIITQLTGYHAYNETGRKIRTWYGHAWRSIVRASILISFSLWVIPDYMPGVPVLVVWHGIVVNYMHLAFFIYCWGIFAIEFDIFYALYAGKHWLYHGTVAIQDRLFGKRAILLLILDCLLFLSGIVWSIVL